MGDLVIFSYSLRLIIRRKIRLFLALILSVTPLAACGTPSSSDLQWFALDKPVNDYSEVSSLFATRILNAFTVSEPTSEIKLDIEPSANVGFLKLGLASNLEYALQILGSNLPEKKIHLIIFKNPNWGKGRLQDIYNMNEGVDYVTKDFGIDRYFDKSACDGPPGLYGYTYEFSEPLILISAQCATSGYLNNSRNSDVGLSIFSHELVHVAQLSWSSGDKNCYLPNWLIEGQAQALSSIFAIDSDLQAQSAIRGDWFNWNPNARLDDNEDYSPPGSDESDGGVYSDGALATEYLIARSGWPKMLKLIEMAEKSANGRCSTSGNMTYFSSAFRLVYSQEYQDFVHEVTGYLRWAIENNQAS